MVGVDFMHTAHEPGVHHDDTMEPVLVKAGILTLTNLCNMTSVSKTKVYLMALPLSLQNVEAGPARAVVFEDAENA
jgi:kynurenine formamidase